MKKYFPVFCMILLSFFVHAHAETGDVTGEIYETDISCFINGTEVPSYNVGGKTAVVIEDTTDNYQYNDTLRTLIVRGFEPDGIKKYDKKVGGTIGKKAGNIYETDIKTYFRGAEIPCYALDGKTAVAVEDLGGDNTFTNTGGKFLWDPEKREISLEVIFDNSSAIKEILKEKHININVGKDFRAVSESAPIMYGYIYTEAEPTDSLPQRIILNDNAVGYVYYPKNCFTFDRKNDEVILTQREEKVLYYFYAEKVRETLKNVETVEPTREDWIKYYEDQMMVIMDRVETESYTFLYMYQPTSHGNTHSMCTVYADGKVRNYDRELESNNIYGIRKYESVEIDKTNNKVRFTYGEKNYEIDLETGKMTILQ